MAGFCWCVSRGLLGLFAEAEASLAHLLEAFPQSVKLLELQADTSYLATENRITPKVRETLDRLLFLDPASIVALEIQVLDAVMAGAHETARLYLEELLDSPRLAGERRALMLGLHERLLESTNQPEQPAAPDRSIQVLVELQEGIQAQPDETVFVFARATDGPPLAVKRLSVGELPALIRLDDSSAMLGQKLSDFSRVRVMARLSRTGDALPGPGDMQAVSRSVQLGNTEVVRLLISDPVTPKQTRPASRAEPDY